LTHNRIRDCGDGILVHSGGLGVFQDNEIQGMRHYGVAIKGSSPTLRKNSIHDCGRVGVYIYDRAKEY
jgi:nitrous oxidase accessory protein NosD